MLVLLITQSILKTMRRLWPPTGNAAEGSTGSWAKWPTTNSSAPLTALKVLISSDTFVCRWESTFCIRQQFVKPMQLIFLKCQIRMFILIGLSSLFYLRPFHAVIIKFNWSWFLLFWTTFSLYREINLQLTCGLAQL